MAYLLTFLLTLAACGPISQTRVEQQCDTTGTNCQAVRVEEPTTTGWIWLFLLAIR